MICVVWLAANPAFGQETNGYAIRSNDGSQQLSDYATYFADTTGLPLEQIQNVQFQRTLPSSIYDDPEVYFWTKLVLSNETSSNQFVITIDQWNEATFYYENSGTWHAVESGTNTQIKNRPLSLHRLLSFPVVIEPGETKTILIRTHITSPLMRYYAKLFSFLSKVEIGEYSQVYRKYIGNQHTVMFLIGILVVLSIYNFSLFFLDNQTTSLLLATYFLCLSVVVANIHGLTTNYFLTSFQAFEMKLALVLAHITPIIIAFFLLNFFRYNLKQWEGIMLTCFIVFMIFSLFYSLETNQSFWYFGRRYIEHLTFLVCTVAALARKKNGAAILLVALVATIVTSLYADFNSILAISSFISPDTPYLVGLIVQTLIFSFAATYRVRTLQKGVETLEQHQRKLMENQNTMLKAQVEEKTFQLQKALAEVQVQKFELEKVNEELLTHTESIRQFNNKLEQTVVERTEALRSAMNDLETFLYHTSHDLRRPLMTILGITNLMRLDGTSEMSARYNHHLNLINNTVNDLDRMLKKLIAISMCYREDLEREPVNIASFVEECIDTLIQQSSVRDAQIVRNYQSERTITSNPYLLRIIINSILENSFHFGGRSVNIVITTKLKGDKNLSLIIQDNGPGIEEQYMHQIFEMFFRANERSSGNGLGLYLAKAGMATLGGCVTLSSKVGEGTTVELVFPADPAIG